MSKLKLLAAISFMIGGIFTGYLVVVAKTKEPTENKEFTYSCDEFVGDESDLQQVKLDIFDQNLVSEDNELKLHISSDTVIINSHGETLEEADISGNTLFVFYTITTRSIPAQTTPHMIIIIDE
ncbi:hypothetical protein [Halalkalibacter alkaliphilus]|uniref:Uncharacterized protein n=1 Tax=Halalkalibacter alkaliphilus TaxID=2917993 RepID=A0A9X2CT65_9BACI|nr:hypothetical protein [Halalkalibacter alkaliphilus]MCL7747825.1 hypothetical protein [Halalkalibacter alkaliphilus]